MDDPSGIKEIKHLSIQAVRIGQWITKSRINKGRRRKQKITLEQDIRIKEKYNNTQKKSYK